MFWIQYYNRGTCHRESSRSRKEADAKKLLRIRESEIAKGRQPGVIFDRIRFNDLCDDYLRTARLNGQKSIKRSEQCITHLLSHFKGYRVSEITTPAITQYIEKRVKVVANGTVNLELARLKAILNMAAREPPPRVDRVPFIPMLAPSPPREGFFEAADFDKLKSHLPEYLKAPAEFAFRTGWRVSEVVGITWADVDLDAGTVRLSGSRSTYTRS